MVVLLIARGAPLDLVLVMVSDACSGFSTLYAAVAVSIILACYCRSNWRRLLLLGAVAFAGSIFVAPASFLQNR